MRRQDLESIELKNLSFGYDENELVFKDFNFIIRERGLFYIHGPKGSGKNTLIKILLGLLPPSGGDFFINGTRVNEFSHQEFDLFRLSMGHAFDVGGLINNQTLYENFRLILDYHDYLDPAERFDYIVDLLRVFHLDEKKHLRPAAVSASDRKAAVILRSLILKPQLLILDNPTQGLSTEHIPHFIELLHEHSSKHDLRHIMISSEDRNLLEKLPGRVFKVTATGLEENPEARRMVA